MRRRKGLLVTINLEIPRERYGLIVELAERMKERQMSFGKTALQKLVYFLQELYKVECGYHFSLYTYGPFSSLLVSDLDSVSAFRGVEIEYSGQGYEIEPGPKAASVREHAKSFIDDHDEAIENIVDEFGKMWANQLELRATIVFAERDARASGEVLSIEDLVSVVSGIKPHFSESAIMEAINEMKAKGYIKTKKNKQLSKA
jgi:uncharacterized protein